MMYQADGRSQFLQYDRPSLLYYWHMIDIHQMLANTLSMLPAEFAVGSGGGTNVIDLTNSHLSATASLSSQRKQQQYNMQQMERSANSSAITSLLTGINDTMKSMAPAAAGSTDQRDKSETMYRLKTAEDSFIKFMDLVQRRLIPDGGSQCQGSDTCHHTLP